MGIKNSTLNKVSKYFTKHRVLFICLLFCSFTSFDAFAQPANDDPCNAIELIPADNCNYESFSNAGATPTAGVPAPGCANYLGGDIWFKITVPCTGTVLVDTKTDQILDGGMALYSGTCNNLTLLTCNDDGSDDGAMPKVSASGLAPGSTVWVRFWEYGNNNNGGFAICVTIPPPGPVNSNCYGALPFCTSQVYTFPNSTGLPDVGAMSCLSTTPNPSWYYLQMQTSGNIVIGISQEDNNGNEIDVDFALWGPFSNITNACPQTTPANLVDCSYSPDGVETAVIPNAVAGEYYLMLLTNYENVPGQITFEQTGGTGATNCGLVCTLTSGNSGPVCPGGTFNLTASTVATATYSWVGPHCWTSGVQNPTNIPAPTEPGSYEYTVTATTPSGAVCISTTTVVVAYPTGTAVTTPSTCQNAVDGTIRITASPAGTYTYTLNPGGISNTTGIFTGLLAGPYSVSFVNSVNCPGSVTGIVVGQGTQPTATATTVSTTCPGANNGSIIVSPNTNAGPGPFVYVLTPGNITQSTGIFTGLANGTYSVSFTNPATCVGTVSGIVVSNGPTPTGSFIKTNATCPGVNNGSITATPGGIAPYTFTLMPGNITQSNPTFTGIAPGTYSISFTNGNNCTGTIPGIIITSGPAPTGTATATATTCPGVNNGTVTVVTPTGPGITYTINPGNISNTTGVFNNLAPATYIVTFQTAIGCTGTVPVNPVVATGPAPTGTATATGTSCPGINNGTVTVTSPMAPGNIYTINPGNISNTTGIFTNLGSGTYTVSFQTALGCTGVVTVNPVVTQGPTPLASVTPVNPLCAGINDGTVTITPNGAPTTYTYTLNPGSLTNTTGLFTGLTAGVAYTYSFQSAAGCIGGGNFTLTTNTPIVVPVTLTMPLCNGTATGIIAFTPSGGVAPYQYSANGGTTYQASNTFTAQLTGAHTFRIKDAVNCIRDTTVFLAQPTVLVSSSTNTTPTGCGNTDGVITITASGGTTPYTYQIAGPTVNTTGVSTGIFTGLGTGSYTLTTTDAKGCTSVSNATVVLVDNMFLNAGNDTTICAEQTITFQPQTNAGTNIFLWTTTNTTVGNISNANTANASITPSDTASYHLHAEWGACSREDDLLVNLLHKPKPSAGRDTAICNISYAILRGSATDLSGTVNYSWSPVTNIENPDQPVTRVFPPGNNTTYTYTLTVTDNYGCNFSVTDDVKVRVQPPVPAFAGNDTTVVKGVPHQLFGSGGSTYLWSPATNLNSPFNPNPLATLQNDTKFILTVTDVAGCIGYDTVFMKVYEGPTYYMPNAFTPNGDGLNDVFRAIPVGISSTQYFRIFNRFGELMFETSKWLNGWDGSYRGKQQPMGVYVWIIKGVDRNGKSVEMKGTVMLTH